MSSSDMIPPGGSIDPVLQRPFDETQRAIEETKEKTDAAQLYDHAKFLSVEETEASKILMGIVEEVLFKRIQEILIDDGQAKACMEILNQIGEKRSMALVAVKKLIGKGRL